jgi:hypothetical protein
MLLDQCADWSGIETREAAGVVLSEVKKGASQYSSEHFPVAARRWLTSVIRLSLREESR